MIAWFQGKGLLYFVRLVILFGVTGYNFWLALIRWGWGAPNAVVSAKALLVAGVIELGLAGFLIAFHLEFYREERRGHWVIGWGVGALFCVAVSLYVNMSFFGIQQQDIGGNTIADLLIQGVSPMAILIGAALFPPKKLRSIADIQSAHTVKA